VSVSSIVQLLGKAGELHGMWRPLGVLCIITASIKVMFLFIRLVEAILHSFWKVRLDWQNDSTTYQLRKIENARLLDKASMPTTVEAPGPRPNNAEIEALETPRVEHRTSTRKPASSPKIERMGAKHLDESMTQANFDRSVKTQPRRSAR
jgi:hypothetical protein